MDPVFLTRAQKPGTTFRLKIGEAPKSSGQTFTNRLQGPEKDLADIIDLSPAARKQVEDSRKVDGYLRFFSSALKIFGFGGYTSSSYQPKLSNIDIEIVPPPKKDS